VGNADNAGLERRRLSAKRAGELLAGTPGVAGHWADCDWIYCTDGKWRPVEPGTFPLVNEFAGRVEQVRAYGNAIVAEAAAEFIRAAREAIDLTA
jgi:DNA (cytosine-5)-methyltransferase 1